MKRLLLTFSIALFSLTLSAQYRIDWGFKLGGANYLGEMGGDDGARRDFVYDMKLNQTNVSAGAFFRYRLTEKVAFNTGFNYGRIQGSDALSQNRGRVGRNLSFRNDLFELYARADIFLYSIYDLGHRRGNRWAFHSYMFMGVAGVYHNPKAQLDGVWHDLRPLRTEGQLAPYGLLTTAIPKGVGMYFTHRNRFKIGWELGWRTTFTDYLDDVSSTYADPTNLTNETAVLLANRNPELVYEENSSLPGANNYFTDEKRGDPTNNDSYMFTQITFSWVVRRSSNWILGHPHLIQNKRHHHKKRGGAKWRRYWISF
jgi:hypothetical protein